MTWLSCAAALCNANRTTTVQPYECCSRFAQRDSFNHMLYRVSCDQICQGFQRAKSSTEIRRSNDLRISTRLNSHNSNKCLISLPT